MLLKLSYILLGYMLVDGFFLKTNGENVTLQFTTFETGPAGKIHSTCSCAFNGVTFPCDTITVNENDRMNLIFTNKNYMNIIECWVESNQRRKQLFQKLQSKRVSSNMQLQIEEFPIDSVSNSVAGSWSCSVYTLHSEVFDPSKVKINGSYYLPHNCSLNVFVKPLKEGNGSKSDPPNYYWIYIAVAVVVAVIIIAQTAVILYLKSKAKKTPRLDSLSLRTHNRDENDKKRYSQPPGVKKSRFSRMLRRSTNKDDETIYETLEELRNAGEQTPPVPPIETIPTLKKKKNSQGSPDVMSKSLPRPEKVRPVLPTSNTMHRIPEREPPPEMDISRRPPLPLPTEKPEERSATPSRVQRAFTPIEEEGRSTPHTHMRPRPGIGQASVASELDSILKMRKASLAIPSAKNSLPASPRKQSFPSLRRKLNKAASDVENSGHGKFVPESPNPLPIGKSAILLGLAPIPEPKPKTNAIKQPPNPSLPKPFGTSGPPKPFKSNPALKTPVASKKPAVSAVSSVKPPAGSVMLPRPPMASTTTHIASVLPPKPSMPPAKPPGTVFKPQVAHKIPPSPVKPMTQNPHLPKFERPAPSLPIGKLPPLPPPNMPEQEDVYEEFTDEPVYNSDEEWTYEPLQQYNIYSS